MRASRRPRHACPPPPGSAVACISSAMPWLMPGRAAAGWFRLSSPPPSTNPAALPPGPNGASPLTRCARSAPRSWTRQRRTSRPRPGTGPNCAGRTARAPGWRDRAARRCRSRWSGNLSPGKFPDLPNFPTRPRSGASSEPSRWSRPGNGQCSAPDACHRKRSPRSAMVSPSACRKGRLGSSARQSAQGPSRATPQSGTRSCRRAGHGQLRVSLTEERKFPHDPLRCSNDRCRSREHHGLSRL